MVTLFKRSEGETSLDARIAELSARRQRIIAPEPQGTPLPANGQHPAVQGDQPAGLGQPIVMPEEQAPPPVPIEERLKTAREELIARLSVEIRPERRSQLTRADLAKIVDAAVQAYFIRFALDANPLERRDLVTAIMQALLVSPGAVDTGGKAPAHRGAIHAAKAAIQPVIPE